GSYYVESLTRKMAQEIRGLIEKIDALGGAVAAIETGYIQREIDTRAYAFQKEVEEKKRVVVGVNDYRIEESPNFAIFRPDPAHARKQVSDLKKLRETRDQSKVQTALDVLREAAPTAENLMPFFIEAVKAYATLGEICGVLRDVFGEYQQAETIGKR
ncbi:MAG: methylmalonyl-CoA mutase family protein, partial [Desulfobacteraceae bacterium]|nr:methylmalonyl-CoA mutase family protein [Desulfobacteraceae bacterium]